MRPRYAPTPRTGWPAATAHWLGRRVVEWLVLFVGVMGAISVAQSQDISAIGSYVELQAQVIGPSTSATLYSSTDVSGNDVVRWTSLLQSRLNSPFTAEGEVALPPGQSWEAGSVKAPPNTIMGWQVNGSWVSQEPAQGTTVTAVRWQIRPLFEGKQTTLPESINFQGTGDGERIIPYKDRFYVVNHGSSTSGTDRNPLGCRIAATGAACPGFEGGNVGFQLQGGLILQGQTDYVMTLAPIEAVNQQRGRLYVPWNTYILCVDLTTPRPTSCAAINLNSPSSQLWGLDTIGNEFYVFADSTGKLMCFDIEKETPCGSWDMAPYANWGGTDGKAIGSKLFFNNGHDMQCFDTTTKARCTGWPTGGLPSGDLVTNVHADRNGVPDGVCSSGNSTCFTLDGQTFTPSAAFASFMDQYAFWWDCCERPSTFVDGRLWSVSPAFNGKLGCFDFRTDAPCSNFPSMTVADTLPYTTRLDPTRPNCLLVLGDRGMGTMVDVTTGQGCKGGTLSQLPPIDVRPSEFYRCDAARAQVKAWRDVRISPSVPWGTHGLSGVTVTLKDGAGNLLPTSLNPTRNFESGKFSLSIADIPYALYPQLQVQLDIKGATSLPANTGYGIDVTWDGDPVQVCFSTQMPASPNCQMTAQLTVHTRAIDSTEGTWQETQQATKVLSLGGLAKGYAAFTTATSARINLSDLSPLDPKTQVLQGRWALQNFSGDVWAFQMGSDGQIDASGHHSAEDGTPSAALRSVYTSANPTGASAPVKLLTWENLQADQQTSLNRDMRGVADTRGPDRLAYLRGTDGNFRSRQGNRLGPVLSSAPIVLPLVPLAGLPENQFPGYADYRKTTPRNHPLAIWGGNDGALHGYEARSGGLVEAWSFVPDVMLKRAAQFSDPDIMGIRANPYFVDNVPIVGHAKLSATLGWRAVAVSTYGRGARAITALDVTYANLSRGAGVLFEYTNTTDPELKDLGYIISQPGTNPSMQAPQLVQLGSQRSSAVLVGNGINSHDGNGGPSASGTGKAVLYAFYLDPSGTKRWHRWAVDELWSDASTEPGLTQNNGLSTPTPVDSNGDGIVDTVYAGDLQGNLWRFDISSPDAAAVTRLFKTADNQPITQAPAVVLNPAQRGCGADSTRLCWQVIWSTGAPIAPLVGSPNVSTQSLYSVLDRGQGHTVNASDLLTLNWATNQTVLGVEYRALDYQRVDYSSKLGWMVNLQAYEHGVGAPRMQPTGLLMFSSIRPTTPGLAINVCVGPRAWLTEVDPLNGATQQVLFDTNHDTTTDRLDLLNPTSSTPLSPQSMAVSGAQFGPPTILLPANANSQQMSLLLPSLGQDTSQANSWSGGTSGGMGSGTNGTNSSVLTHANRARLGRMSWREIY